MGEIAAASAASGPSQHCFPAVSRSQNILNLATMLCLSTEPTGLGSGYGSSHLKHKKWREQTVARAKPKQLRPTSAPATSSAAPTGKDPRPTDLVTFSANVSTNTPFYEPPGVSFDEYLKDRPRIFRAMFPDKRRSGMADTDATPTVSTQRLNDEEWQIQMLPIQFLLVSVNPVVVMRLRCKSGGQGYPPSVPLHVGRVLELQATKWELRGLDAFTMPSNFVLSVQGLLYSERSESSRQSRLKGRLELSISLVLPAWLAMVPEDILRATADLVLRRLVETMKQEVHGGLLDDFRSFGRQRLMKQGETAAIATD